MKELMRTLGPIVDDSAFLSWPPGLVLSIIRKPILVPKWLQARENLLARELHVVLENAVQNPALQIVLGGLLAQVLQIMLVSLTAEVLPQTLGSPLARTLPTNLGYSRAPWFPRTLAASPAADLVSNAQAHALSAKAH